jgi:formate dehydrogenase major subunit
VARKIKDTRDATFQTTDDNGVTVNRTNGTAFIGGAANNDEDCYIAVKLARALGLVYIEHQARI